MSDHAKLAELRPCPFCGGEAEIKQTSGDGYTVRCRSCLHGRTQRVIRKSMSWLRGQMVISWNTRTALPFSAEIAEALVDVHGRRVGRWPSTRIRLTFDCIHDLTAALEVANKARKI